MAIENTPIYDEVNKILAGTEAVSFKWECEILAGKNKVVPFNIETVDIVRDYNGSYSDDIQISMLIPEGDFNKLILPFLGAIEVVLKKTPIAFGAEQNNPNINIEVQRYRGVYLDKPSTHIKGATPDNVDVEGANLNGFKKVKFQLMDMVIEQLRGRIVGGLFKKTTTANVLRVLLGAESKKLDVTSEVSIKGVSMVDPSNTTVRSVIDVKPIPLIDLPLYLQSKCGGIYSADVGFYLQKGMWYIYPRLDITRFTKELKTLTIINVPSNKLPGVERTFRTTGNQVIVLCTGSLKHIDDSDTLQLNEGSGVRFTDANKIMDGFGKYEDGKYSVTRAENNSEFIAFDRPTGINKVMVSEKRITSNPFNEYAKLARRNCSHIFLVWENSNESLIYPGMPCKLIYEDNGIVKETEGIVNQAHHYMTGQSSSLIDSRYSFSTALTLLVANPKSQ